MAAYNIKEALEKTSESIGGGVYTALDTKQDICRVSALPVASVDYKNVLYQYIGPTTREYIHNYYYECALDGNSYVWVRRDVCPTSSRKILVPIPEVTVGTYTYNGEAQGPVVKGLELPRLNITNETATNAGEYSLTASLKDVNTTVFEDGGSSDKTWDYEISKISQIITLSSDAVEFDNDHVEFEIDVTGVLTSLSVLVDDESIVTATNTNDKIVLTGTGTNGTTSVTVYAVGDENHSVSQMLTIDITTDYHIVLKGFGEATDEELVAMIEAADRGEIDLYEDAGWRVGDTRTISLPSMSTVEVNGQPYAAGTNTLVLMHRGGYEYVNPIENGRSTCSFIVGIRDCLSRMDQLNKNNVKLNWGTCGARTWCNNIFYNAIPSSIRSIFKQVKVPTAYSCAGANNEITNDYFFFPAEKEVFGTRKNGATVEANALQQWDWYKTHNNKGVYWHLRSPYSDGYDSSYYANRGYFCYVSFDNTASFGQADSKRYAFPAGCI